VINKIDLESARPARETRDGMEVIALSAKTGAGLDLLRVALKQHAGASDAEQGAFSARARHVLALQRAQAHMEAAEHVLRETRAGELAAEELRQAQRHLGEITGEFTSEDLLGAIFSTFCIGK
jgi:tRNA modification GTPase